MRWPKEEGARSKAKCPKQKLRLVVADVDLVNGRINLERELRVEEEEMEDWVKG